jgi:hypothetical protein
MIYLRLRLVTPIKQGVTRIAGTGFQLYGQYQQYRALAPACEQFNYTGQLKEWQEKDEMEDVKGGGGQPRKAVWYLG